MAFCRNSPTKHINRMRVKNAAVLLLNLAVDKVTTRFQSVKITSNLIAWSLDPASNWSCYNQEEIATEFWLANTAFCFAIILVGQASRRNRALGKYKNVTYLRHIVSVGVWTPPFAISFSHFISCQFSCVRR